MQLTVTSKNYWGMWHPNIINSLITACCLAFYFFEKKKLYICSLILLAVVAMETISRTYLFIPLLTLPLLFPQSFIQKHSKIIKFSYQTLALIALLLSFLLILPNFIQSILSSKTYYTIDHLLSYRLSIFNSAINQLSVTEYFFGSLGTRKEVDSFFINLMVNHGLIIYMAFFFFITYGILKKRQNIKRISCIAIFLLLGNFEDISGSSSITFILFVICLMETFKPRKTPSLNTEAT